MNFALLLRRDLALEPDEALRRVLSRSRNSVASRSGSTAVSSSTASSTSMMRRGSANSDGDVTSVARIWPLRSTMSGRAVAIAFLRAGAAHDMAFRRDREHDEPRRDHGIDRGERENRQPDAGARLGGAVDVAAVEQGADQPPAPGFGRLPDRAPRLADCASASIATRSSRPALPAAMLPASSRSAVVVGFSIMDADRIARAAAANDLRRPLRQWSSESNCVGVQRPQRQMAPDQALDARGIVERRPFRAQRRDGVALAPDVAAHLGDALGAQCRFELDLVDVGRGEHQQRQNADVEEAHGHRPFMHVGERRQPRQQAGGVLRPRRCRRCARPRAAWPSARADWRQSRPSSADDRPLGQKTEARRRPL